ncbi:hypothetical protein [Streptomyces sp. 891-h]|uniref:hypothetical protein n=1 Tax=Streptomyces sp. 891-h TaxID=2720714 RepID=UPI001FAAF9C3|nr:hypothetical protein [Streptomyces sp. 891-h]UNZ19563.1 hypothetical protein HC362_23535 [Streptomyces sp. 891-h]
MAENPDSPIQSLSRHLRQQLHLHGRRAVESTFLHAVWKTSKIEARSRILARLAWHARDHAVRWPTGEAHSFAAELQQAACQRDDIVPFDRLLARTWPVQMEAALVLLAACPNRAAALPVEIAQPEDTP